MSSDTWGRSRSCKLLDVFVIPSLPPVLSRKTTNSNGSAYIDHRTRSFARELGLEPLTTPVRSPQSNGMAESFVKTMKHDYVAYMDKPDAPTALSRLAIAFEHYNERHPHKALKYRSPREFRRNAVSSSATITTFFGRRFIICSTHSPGFFEFDKTLRAP